MWDEPTGFKEQDLQAKEHAFVQEVKEFKALNGFHPDQVDNVDQSHFDKLHTYENILRPGNPKRMYVTVGSIFVNNHSITILPHVNINRTLLSNM